MATPSPKNPTPKPAAKDWTNSPSSLKWGKVVQNYEANKATESAKRLALAKMATKKKSSTYIPASPTH